MNTAIAVVNLKGGVGKTTTVVQLAHIFSAAGRTLAVDADPQGSALAWSERAGGFPYSTISLPVRDLHKRLPELAREYQYVVIDTPPGDGDKAITRSALMAAHQVIVPVAPSTMDIDRFQPTLDLLVEVDDLHPLRYNVLLTRVRAGTKSARETREVLESHGVPIFATEIPLLEAYAGAFGTLPTPVTTERYSEVINELLDARAAARAEAETGAKV